MHTVLIFCLVTIAVAQYNYFPQSRLVANRDAHAESGETSQEDDSGPAAYRKYDKQFFSFSAQESEFDDDHAVQRVSAGLQNNLRVIFIKGPESSGLESAALQLAKNSVNERTAIYVFNKQADIGDLTNKLNAIYSKHNSRPEVHFVKYRTPTDAANAQRAIQSQFESLPGTSSSLLSGSAPVLDFAPKAPVQLVGQSNSESTNSVVPPNTSYLPPGRRS